MTKKKRVFCNYETLISEFWLTGWPDARTMVPGDAKRTKPHTHTHTQKQTHTHTHTHKTVDLQWTGSVVCSMSQTVTSSQLAFQLRRTAGWAIDS
jgi:hypothetical protein